MTRRWLSLGKTLAPVVVPVNSDVGEIQTTFHRITCVNFMQFLAGAVMFFVNDNVSTIGHRSS